MKTVEEAEELAHLMVQIGQQLNRKTLAVISDMNQPLGYAIGNALEVKEAIETLQGKGPEDLTELCLVLGSQMLLAAETVSSLEEGKKLLQSKIDNGDALEKFRQMIDAQEGDSSVIDHPEKLVQAKYQIPLLATQDGVLSEWIANEVGEAAMMLGAGRETLEDTIDPFVGMILHAKVGDKVTKGQPLLTIHSNRENVDDVMVKLQQVYTISTAAEAPTLIHKVITD